MTKKIEKKVAKNIFALEIYVKNQECSKFYAESRSVA